ncbi:MAG: mechanosensitive ion channel [bacterium]|nr:mechanosensitive ion channel [bacterium]
MEKYLDLVQEWAALYGIKVVGAIVILIVGRIVVSIVSSFVNRLLKRSNTDDALTNFFTTLTRVSLYIFVLLAVLNTLGVETASLIAVIGAAGLAVGFALQGSLSNLASGIMLILFRPFRANDLVETGGHLGVVQEIHIFHTVLKSPDNKRVIIPNSKVTGDSIVNYSAEGVLRVDLVFGISYGDEIAKAKSILMKILEEHELVLSDPAPTVAVKELGNSSVDFVVRPYVKVEHYWNVYFSVTEKVKTTFDSSGVSIPFPQRDVHLFQKNAS